MKDNLKAKTISGFIYKLFERIGAKGIYFFVSILLARLILPNEFGIIALVMIFVEICDVFVSHGFGNALIVYQDSDEVDFSTCFWFCLGLSALLFGAVWFSSDLIASFFDKYDSSLLSLLIKVMAARIPLAAINTVQHAFIKKNMLFKKFFWATIVGTLISGGVAVWMAFSGHGVWALVEQYLGNILIDTILITIVIRWRPRFVFSIEKLKRILKYGWKVLIVGLIDTGYAQMRSIVVGKKYSSEDLAFYSKGTTIPQTGVSVFEDTLSEVFYSAISNCNDDKSIMVNASRKVMAISTFLIFPIVVGIGAVGKEMIVCFMTEKWLPALVFLEIGCLAFLFRPVQIINSCIIGASGKSNLLLISDIINKCIGIGLLFFFLFLENTSVMDKVIGIAFSYAITNIISTLINIAFVKKIIPYSYLLQFKDIFKNLITALLMGASVLCFSYFVNIGIVGLKLFIEVTLGIILYFAMSFLFKNKSLYTVISIVRDKLKHQ